MPHLFTNRRRQYKSGIFKGLAQVKRFSLEALNAMLYLFGGAVFLVGSIFFLPQYENFAALGAWLFFCGSVIYLLVTAQDLFETLSCLRSQHALSIWHGIELLSAIGYVIGTALFAIGSLLFLPTIQLTHIGAWCFIWGSMLFILGAFVNVLQIIEAGSELTLQLSNAVAITFTLGSVLFLVASIPYLWELAEGVDKDTIFAYVAWEYIAGSLLFFGGGIFNYFRSRYARHYYRQTSESKGKSRRKS